MIDFPFVLRNSAGLLAARVIERVPATLPWLRRSRSTLKPFIASWLRGSRLRRESVEQVGPFRMHLRLDDHLQLWIYLGLYEKAEIEACRPLVKPGSTCIDVGANVGYFTLHFAAWVGPTGRVIACEPDPAVAAELRRNCALNGFDDRVEVLDVAVSDRVDVIRFVRSTSDNSGWGSVLPQPGNAGGSVLEVSATTLDEIVSMSGIDDAACVKIDVEGYEFAVLAGAAQSMKAGVLQNILIEWFGPSHTAQNESLQTMDAVFRQASYVPDELTGRVFNDISSGRTDPRSLFTNLMYRRSRV